MKPANLAELRSQFAGTRFAELVHQHVRRQSQRERIQGIQGTVALLPAPARPLAEGFIDVWNARAYDPEFWQRDSASVFDEIIAEARNLLRPLGRAGDDEAVFNLFNVVVLSYAYSAYDQPKMRKFMGLREHFPWLSAVALLYPVGATVYIATSTPAGFPSVIGYGIANLGYLLFAAGLFAGTFRVLGLKNRWQTIGAAILALGVGTVLSNMGASSQL
jgi:hypothetical protein